VNVSGFISATQVHKNSQNGNKKRKKERNVEFYYSYAVAIFLLSRKSSLISIKESKNRRNNKPNVNTSGASGLFLSISSKVVSISKKVPDTACLKCAFTCFAQQKLLKSWYLCLLHALATGFQSIAMDEICDLLGFYAA
jgi:hypothetical protein